MPRPYKAEVWAYPLAPTDDWSGVVAPLASIDDPAAKTFIVHHPVNDGPRLWFTDKVTAQAVAKHLFLAFDAGRGAAQTAIREAIGL